MSDIPLMYVVTCDGDTSDADYLGVSKSLTATGSQYRVAGPLAKVWASALMAERKKALEEAAKVAEEFNGMKHAAHDMATGAFPKQSYMGEAIAAAIRKLGEEPSHYPVLKPYLPPDSFTEEELKAAIQKVTRKD